MVNLFAWRARDPRELVRVDDPVGRANDAAIDDAIQSTALVVACWGEHGKHLTRDNHVTSRYGSQLHCLKQNRSGAPTHPLYLPAQLRPYPLPCSTSAQ